MNCSAVTWGRYESYSKRKREWAYFKDVLRLDRTGLTCQPLNVASANSWVSSRSPDTLLRRVRWPRLTPAPWTTSWRWTPPPRPPSGCGIPPCAICSGHERWGVHWVGWYWHFFFQEMILKMLWGVRDISLEMIFWGLGLSSWVNSIGTWNVWHIKLKIEKKGR